MSWWPSVTQNASITSLPVFVAQLSFIKICPAFLFWEEDEQFSIDTIILPDRVAQLFPISILPGLDSVGVSENPVAQWYPISIPPYYAQPFPILISPPTTALLFAIKIIPVFWAQSFPIFIFPDNEQQSVPILIFPASIAQLS